MISLIGALTVVSRAVDRLDIDRPAIRVRLAVIGRAAAVITGTAIIVVRVGGCGAGNERAGGKAKTDRGSVTSAAGLAAGADITATVATVAKATAICFMISILI